MWETWLVCPVYLYNFMPPTSSVMYANNSKAIVLFAADWNHPFHCSPDSLFATGSGSSLVVLAPLLHGGKYRFIYYFFYLISSFLSDLLLAKTIMMIWTSCSNEPNGLTVQCY